MASANAAGGGFPIRRAMKLKLSRDQMRDQVKVKKAAFISITVNVL